MRDLVLDASAALDVVLRRGIDESVIDVLESASRVVAPRLYLSETANALWKYAQAGHIEDGQAQERLHEAAVLVVHPIADEELVSEALSTAVRFDHPVYDTMYAVLARRLSCGVVTRDQRLKDLLEQLRVDAI